MIVEQHHVRCRSPIIKKGAVRAGNIVSPSGAVAVKVTSIDARCCLTRQAVNTKTSSKSFVYIGDGNSFNFSGDPLDPIIRHGGTNVVLFDCGVDKSGNIMDTAECALIDCMCTFKTSSLVVSLLEQDDRSSNLYHPMRDDTSLLTFILH